MCLSFNRSSIRVLGGGSEDRRSDTLRPAGGVLAAGGAGGPAAEGNPEEECGSRVALPDAEKIRQREGKSLISHAQLKNFRSV